MLQLKEIRKSKNLTQSAVASYIGITQQGYASYENGKANPDPDMLVKIAELFDCSIDHLLGHNTNNEKIESNLDQQLCRLQELRKKKGVKQLDVARYLGISRQSYGHYETGIREPDISTLKELAKYFNCTIDFLLGLNSNDINIVNSSIHPPNLANYLKVSKEINKQDDANDLEFSCQAYEYYKTGTIVNKIRHIRKFKKLTMKQVGDYLGVSESTVSMYETGKRQPNNETLIKLSKLFNVSIDCILGVDDNPRTISNPHIHTSITVPNLNNVSADISIIDIVEVKKLYQDTAVNKYLNNNWILLSIISESIDEQPNTNRCTFIIGRPKNVNQ